MSFDMTPSYMLYDIVLNIYNIAFHIMRRLIIFLSFLLYFEIILNPINVNAKQEVDEGHVLFEEIINEEYLDYSSLRLNEVMPNPEGSDTDYEWIEIYNGFSETTDLTECILDSKQFPAGYVIEGNGFLLIVRDLLDKDGDDQFFEQRWGNGSGIWGDWTDEDFNVIEMNISMGNSNDSISLVCGESEDIFEWEEAISGQSFSIDNDGEWSIDYLVTPGRENEEEPDIIYSHDILISELYPSPDSKNGEEEWIEIYNFGSTSIELTDWIIEDSSNKYTFNEGILIDSGEYLVVESELSITLNNSGEEIYLLDPNGEVVDVFEYDKTARYISNIRLWNGEKYFDEIVQTQLVTKGKVNEFVDPGDIFYGREVLNIQEARKFENGEYVCTEGVITVEINLLGKKVFYIQDETAGIQVYLYKEEYWDNFLSGDKMKLYGELKEVNGEKRLYVNDMNAIKKISQDEEITYLKIATGEINEFTEGSLVFVSGKIIKTSGKTFYIDDGSGEVKVIIKSSTSIDTPEKRKGQYAGIIGIISQYGEDENGNPSYRILPRYASDIVISDDPVSMGQVLAVTGRRIFYFQIIGLLILAILSIRYSRNNLLFRIKGLAKLKYIMQKVVK